jgi:hypothetical protein
MRLLTPTPEFTYADSEDAAWRRRVIHGIEQLTGKPRLWRLYADYCSTPAAQDFFAEAEIATAEASLLELTAPPPDLRLAAGELFRDMVLESR